jgi:trehalose 2-sulfotransferase
MTRSIAQHDVPYAAGVMPHDLPDRPRQLAIAPPPAWPSEHGPRVVPKSSFFICHTLRCGSTLLCDALSSTGMAGHPEEYFPERARSGGAWVATGAALRDPDTWRCDWTNTPFEQCLDRVLSSGTTPNGVFASKVKWFNVPCLGELLGVPREPAGLSLAEHLDGLFPQLRYVWVTRRDKVRQAVSLVKARQSTEWKAMSAQPERSDAADYNFHLVDLAVRRIVQEECSWEEYFTRAGVTPFTVVYEDLVRDYESTVRGLLDNLEIRLPREYVFPVPRLHKQADAVSEEWVERYRRGVRSSRMWRTVINLPALLLKQRIRESYILPRLQR